MKFSDEDEREENVECQPSLPKVWRTNWLGLILKWLIVSGLWVDGKDWEVGYGIACQQKKLFKWLKIFYPLKIDLAFFN